MFQVTERAGKMMQEYFREKNISPSIRIMLMQGG
jgi:hypothetical protein